MKNRFDLSESKCVRIFYAKLLITFLLICSQSVIFVFVSSQYHSSYLMMITLQIGIFEFYCVIIMCTFDIAFSTIFTNFDKKSQAKNKEINIT